MEPKSATAVPRPPPPPPSDQMRGSKSGGGRDGASVPACSLLSVAFSGGSWGKAVAHHMQHTEAARNHMLKLYQHSTGGRAPEPKVLAIRGVAAARKETMQLLKKWRLPNRGRTEGGRRRVAAGACKTRPPKPTRLMWFSVACERRGQRACVLCASSAARFSGARQCSWKAGAPPMCLFARPAQQERCQTGIGARQSSSAYILIRSNAVVCLAPPGGAPCWPVHKGFR